MHSLATGLFVSCKVFEEVLPIFVARTSMCAMTFYFLVKECDMDVAQLI